MPETTYAIKQKQGDEPPSTPPAMIGLIFLLAIGLVVGLTAKPSGSTVNVHLGDGMVSSSNSAPSDNLSGTSITVDVDVDSSVSINTVASKVLDLALPYGAGMWSRFYPASALALTDTAQLSRLDVKPIGGTSAHICEASDALDRADLIVDGQSGDTEYPFGKIKPIATVGEYDSDAELVVGVPDGMGAILVDDDTVRVIVQSESYGPVTRYESYPWYVNGKSASFTGSHVQYIDYDRTKLAAFHDEGAPETIEDAVKGSGELIKRAYNLKGELIGPRNTTLEADGSVGATKTGAHFSNTDKDGNWVTGTYNSHGIVLPTFADWNMMSLCSAHLEEKHQWGTSTGGLEDDLYMTNEEWMKLPSTVDSYVGLAAHAVDVKNQAAYALGAFTQGGFEKIIEFSTEEGNYVAFSPSGYNGAFGATSSLFEAKRTSAYGARDDGSAYVYPQNIVPARVYIGKKGFDEQGNACSDFLCRNGLRYGKLYGFAVDQTASDFAWRDTWHKTHVHGDQMPGRFYQLKSWTWDGTVKNFEYDGSWEFQDYPKGTDGSQYLFWTALGPNTAGKKTEHNAPALNSNLPSAFIQTSTAGYFGEYSINGAAGIAGILSGLASGVDFPDYMDANYYLYQGETDVSGMIHLGGKGIRSDYKDQSQMTDSSKTHVTFEDIDGFETITASEGTYAVIQEDGGNAYGERMFLVKLHKDTTKPLEYKFIAMSGGKYNTRMLAGVGVPAGVNIGAGSHEFSGVIDLTGFFAKNSDGTWKVKVTDLGGVRHAASATMSINDHLIVLGLQAHNMVAGVIQYFAADRGGQWLLYKPLVDTD